MTAPRRAWVLGALVVAQGCAAAEPVGPSPRPAPPPPPVRIVADHEFIAVTGIELGGPFGPALEGEQRVGYDPFRRVGCGGRGDPACGDPVDAQRTYLWEDGSDGELLVRVARHTYPLLVDQRRADLSVRPPVGPLDRITGLRGTWWIIWRDTSMVEYAPLRFAWKIAGRWGTDSVTISVAEDRLPRKVGATDPRREFPEPWVAADGDAYHHPSEVELVAYRGSVMRVGLGYTLQRYGSRCGAALRPVCSRMDPVVVATVHGGGEARLDVRRWQRGGEAEAVARTARPDARGHAIFRHLIHDDGVGGSWFVAGGVSVRCDNGRALEAEVATLQRRSAFHAVENAVSSFAWVFADCDAGIITTMRERYPFIPVVTP